MSRMSKYLKQVCLYEQCKRSENGTVLHDKFGEPLYGAPIQIKCRREISIQDVQTNTGAILKSNTRYFIDNKYKVQADDKLDGKCILKVAEYTNQSGKAEGYECYV